MSYIDMHCDALMAAMIRHGAGASLYDRPEGMVDFKRLKKGGALAQFFAVFIVPEYGYKDWYGIEKITVEEYVKGCIHIFKESIKAHPDLAAQALTADDILENEKKGLLSAVLTLEDCCILNGDPANIDKLYDEGIRVMGLTWNGKNCIGSPNSKDPKIMKEGLTPFGKEAVCAMQEKGIIVDVSHLSDGGFYDVADLAKKPFVATHSNCRALCPHQRNMADDMLRILAEHGGVSGINFGPEFLNEDVTDPNSTIEHMIAMMKHMKKIGGIDMVAIGTDFDGIGGKREVADASEMPKLMDAMEKAGFTEREIRKITRENVLRVMKDCL